MKTKVKILVLENDPNGIGQLQDELKKSGLNYTAAVVQTRKDYEHALSSFNPDIILADYSLPTFDGLSAFRIRQNIAPDTPFIIVSGTIGEENAVELIRMGLTDYVLKEHIYQIIPKIYWALQESSERKQKEAAERQLRQREEQLQKIMDLSLDVICTVDEEGRFVTIGAASKPNWGYLPEDLIGKRVEDLVHPDDQEKTVKAIAELKNGRDLINFENRYIRRDGEVVILSWSAHWDPKEKLGYSVARDVTEMKQAEEKINNNEKRFRTLLQNSKDGLTLLAADGRVIKRSPSALKILEFATNETSGKFRLDLVHPDDLPTVTEAYRQVMNNDNEILTIEYRFLIPDGSYKWLETTFANQLQEPAVGAIVLNYRDITVSKTAELALKKSEEKYRSLFRLSPTPMWVYEVETFCFLDVNEAAVNHYGYSKDDFLAMTLYDIRRKEDLGNLEALVNSLIGTRGHHHYIAKHVKKSGEVIDVEIKNSFIDIGGRETRLVIAADISERMKYIQAIQEQNAMLREIAWIQSHVVRAPLARMMGLINLLDDEMAEKAGDADLLTLISDSAHQLDKIIRDIVKKTEQVNSQQIVEEQLEP